MVLEDRRSVTAHSSCGEVKEILLGRNCRVDLGGGKVSQTFPW